MGDEEIAKGAFSKIYIGYNKHNRKKKVAIKEIIVKKIIPKNISNGKSKYIKN